NLLPGDGAELARQWSKGRPIEDPHRDSDLRDGAATRLQIKKNPARGGVLRACRRRTRSALLGRDRCHEGVEPAFRNAEPEGLLVAELRPLLVDFLEVRVVG